MKDNRVKKITIVALFIALVVIGSKIYVGTHDTFRFHLGNSICLLAALVLSPPLAGLASGLGSMLFDILFYPSGIGCIITFITKFVMSYVTATIFTFLMKHKKDVHKVYQYDNVKIHEEHLHNITELIYAGLSGAVGEIIYIILYMTKTFIERRYVMEMAINAVIPIMIPKFFTSVLNAVVAIIISTLAYKKTNMIIKKFI